MRLAPARYETPALLALGLAHRFHDCAPQFVDVALAACDCQLEPHHGKRRAPRNAIGLEIHERQKELRGRLALVGGAVEEFGCPRAVARNTAPGIIHEAEPALRTRIA